MLGALGRVVRGQAQGVLGELDGLRAGAAGGSRGGGGRDLGGEPGVGGAGGEREVEGAELAVGDRVREGEVELAPLARPGAGLGRRGQQRVRRADAVGVDDHQPGVERVVDRDGVGDRGRLGGAQLAAQRDREQQPARRLVEMLDAGAEHVLDRVREREVLAEVGQAALAHHPPELEREQRVAERGVGDPAQQVAGEREARAARPAAAGWRRS